MKLVVDASVAMKWFVREDFHEHAVSLLERHAGDLEAPDFLVAEIANVAWKKSVRGELTTAQARIIPVETDEYIGIFHPSTDLVHRALDIAITLNHPVYDCLYLACAEAVEGVLVTADERLCRAVLGGDFESMVRYLGGRF